ncbi:LuxR C-terminal-related transcriptional regulator [Gallaecimonas xiamenensis]|uniref:Response regulator receiver protein n=1 Tax=Gallaecimonas xiamenensis 3-C-1 TaxID=745411 RepID=K2JXD8_9GAMM|nr:response regulator transcription factor [Gallaecimonas xiamenensis]EKE74974.1 response regulator receiver protein [Gallaecimonas xiamenensis 3-C-1]
MDLSQDAASVLIVHPSPLLREALQSYIESKGPLRVAGVSDSLEALAMAEHCRPQLVLLALASEDDLSLLSALVALPWSPRVLLLCKALGEPVRAAIRLGASGVLSEDDSGSQLLKALGCVLNGELWVDRALTASLLRDLRKPPTEPSPVGLSPRERQIVALVAQGMSTGRLADQLHISEKTVRNHLSSIYDKLQVADRVELALYALKQGINKI